MSLLALNRKDQPLYPKSSETSPKKMILEVWRYESQESYQGFPELSVGPGRCSGVLPWSVSGIVLHQPWKQLDPTP